MIGLVDVRSFGRCCVLFLAVERPLSHNFLNDDLSTNNNLA